MNYKVSVITVNFYSENEIRNCFNSICEKTSVNFEYIIVSNSPIKDSFRSEFSESRHVLIHETNENLGFAKACNIGAEIAQGEYLFFLNPDTLFLNDVLKELIDCQLKHNNACVLGPKTFKEDLSELPTIKEHFTKRTLYYLMIPFTKYFINNSLLGGHRFIKDTILVPVLNGHALFIPSNYFQELGRMEENFFMYWEEHDIAIKAKKNGYDVLYCQNAKLIHLSGTSTSPFFFKMEIEKHRSRKKYILLHHSEWNHLNRVSGILGYFWRAIGSLFTLQKKKIRQHWSIFLWYCFNYN